MREMSACSPMSETVRLLTSHRTRAVARLRAGALAGRGA